MKPAASDLTKAYPPRGPLQQYRFAGATAFRCFRCGETKKSKLIAVYAGDWERRLCNGCYGRLLSIYEVKASGGEVELRAEQLAEALLAAVDSDDQRRAEHLFRAAERQTELLGSQAVRFVASSEYVAAQLSSAPSLEWSPAVIGICKAVESELVARLLRPITFANQADLAQDLKDKDFGRVAAYCADTGRKPPEIGAIAHFLQTVAHSEARRSTSRLMREFLRHLSQWTDATWVLSPSGLHRSLVRLSSDFRNRAAHTDELNETDYQACRELVIGREGLLWRLVVADQRHR
jgi:hypothetical protein